MVEVRFPAGAVLVPSILWSVLYKITAAVGEYDTGPQLDIAVLNLTHWDPGRNEWRWSRDDQMGIYATHSRMDTEWGRVVHVRSADNRTDGCQLPLIVPPLDRWIALVEKGNCDTRQKLNNIATLENVTAIVIYGHDLETETYQFRHKVDNLVLVFISRQSGEQIALLADNTSLKLTMHISMGRSKFISPNSINKTSVLFVSISFIVLMIISLAWLIFYYIQRFRYTHTKDRLTKRLMNAAKKAINRIPQKTLRKCDIELEPEFDLCAICVENYKVSDVVRLLACRHVFHKSCVDPWLLEQRTCPICKLDILQAYGIQVTPGQEPAVVARPESHPLYLEASSLLLDDNNPRLQSVEMVSLCPRPTSDNTVVAEIVNEPEAESPSEGNASVLVQYPRRQQTLV